MNKTLLESQEGVLYFTSLALSMISTISSVASHSVQNPQTLQRFLNPLYDVCKQIDKKLVAESTIIFESANATHAVQRRILIAQCFC